MINRAQDHCVKALLLGSLMSLFVPLLAAEDASPPTLELEDIYVLRSIREAHEPEAGWCTPDKTGFDPYPTDAERQFSFWSVQSQLADGKVLDAKVERVAGLRACFGATDQPARQNFYAEIQFGGMSFHGKGECLALMLNTPEDGMFPVRCHLILEGMPDPYLGGLLTTNTLTSKAAFGGDSDPLGYTQASIATIRLWKARQRYSD